MAALFVRRTGCLIFFFSLSPIGGEHRKLAEGRTLVTATPLNENDIHHLRALLANMNVDVWDPPSGINRTVRFVVEEEEQGGVVDHLRGDFRGTTQFQDVETMLASKSGGRSQTVGFDLDNYNSHTDMNNFLRRKARSCSLCSVRNLGKSAEGRDMLLLRIGTFSADKRAVWIDAGIHAREWIAPATALYIIEELTKGIENEDEEVLSILESFVIYILPSANPDGYEYSRTTDRLWRKTRSGAADQQCVGVDPNRNWDFHWNEAGASSDPCNQVYAGPVPFSEVETRNIADYLWRNREQFDVYLTIHAYGQYWVSPWGYTSDLPDDYNDLMLVANAALEALTAVHGTEYTVGTSTNVIYAAAGGSDDWAKGVAGIKYSYTLELRDKYNHTGEFYGFLLPPEQIRPTGEETWEAVKTCILKVAELEAEY